MVTEFNDNSYHDNKDTQLTQPDIIINEPSQEGIDNNINTLLLYRQDTICYYSYYYGD